MIGSNSTALRQHAYSVFTASRRERDGANDIPESVLRPMSPSPQGPATLSRMGQAQATPERVAEAKPWNAPASPERGISSGKPGVIEALGSSHRALAPTAGEPSHEDIRARAYQIFQSRGGQPGDPVADWLRAESELRRERGLSRQGR